MAVSVDPPKASEALRTQLSLPFPILCDTERRVVRDWDIYNSREKGGIAKPAVFVIDSNQVIRYASVDSVATRVPAVEIVHLLQNAANARRFDAEFTSPCCRSGSGPFGITFKVRRNEFVNALVESGPVEWRIPRRMEGKNHRRR